MTPRAFEVVTTAAPEPLCKRPNLVTGISADNRRPDDEYRLDGVVDGVRYRIDISHDLGTFKRHVGVGQCARPCLLRQQIVWYVEVYRSRSFCEGELHQTLGLLAGVVGV